MRIEWMRHGQATKKRFGGDHNSERRETPKRPLLVDRHHEHDLMEALEDYEDVATPRIGVITPFTGPRTVLKRIVMAQTKGPAVQVVITTEDAKPRRNGVPRACEGLTKCYARFKSPDRGHVQLARAIGRIALEAARLTC